ncbi:MAG: hypothetical protein HOH77_20490 [Candidatus Latescibacteria bacterium]|nr:hypothetical protein [Candidatus Latescibacterota bacterium]
MGLWLGHVVHADVPRPEVWTLFDGEVRLTADGSRGPYLIAGRAIEAVGIQVWVAGVLQMKDRDYTLLVERAQMTFLKKMHRGDEIVIRFRQVPQVVNQVYRRRVLATEGEDVTDYSGHKQRTAPASEQPVGKSNLQIGGSKSIQVSFGSEQNHRVSQALQMHIAGDISDGVSILAVLSDRNLPLGNQGSTVGLRELDRVLFQVRGPDVAADVGDLDVRLDRTRFGHYRRQLQGARVAVDRGRGSFSAVGAVSRGQWRTHRVVAIEGYQGPYQLPGRNGLLGRVVSESERVYLNEQLLKRGEQLDYVIDYERGVVTFAPEQPIVASSRIRIEYQTLDEGKQSRLVGLDGQVTLGGSGWSVGSTLIRESERTLLVGVDIPGGSGNHRQVTGLDATYAPREGVRLASEVAWSDDVLKKGHALDVDGQWTSDWQHPGALQVTGRFQQMSVGYEGFDRLEVGTHEGRWGWQPEERLQEVREGTFGLRYTFGGVSVDGAWGRRTGDFAAGRKAVGIRVPFGHYEYERIGQDQGGLTRQRGHLIGGLGMFASGVEVVLEKADGDAVSRSSVFYAADPNVLILDGVQLGEATWHIEVGKKKWHWRTEIGIREIRQQNTVWQDSLKAWSHTHSAKGDWKGWTVLGSYGQTVSRSGSIETTRRVTHLGRTRVNFSRPGYSHQIFYRVSSAGVQTRQPVYVEVGRGLGSYVWEDVDGDSEKDAEEFVLDVDGDFELVYGFDSDFLPAREGILGARVEMNLKRLLKRSNGFLAGLSFDASVNADRKVVSNAIGPWHLFSITDSDDLQFAQRDARLRLHVFRYHKRGSLRVSGRMRDRLDRFFYGGGRESLRNASLGGRLRFGREGEIDGDISSEVRKRTGTEIFAFSIRSYSGHGRGSWRPSRRWDMRLGLLGGDDYDRQRDLEVHYMSLQPEMIRRLAGRGRLRARVDWTHVWATDEVPIFLGMANGNRVGQNWVWRLGMDYRFGRYVTALVSYDGRKRPDLPVIHLGRMEMKAVF